MDDVVADVTLAAGPVETIRDGPLLRGHSAAAVSRAGSESIRVVKVKPLYPEGGERQLIQVLTGLEVPSGGRPAVVASVSAPRHRRAGRYRA